MKQFSRSKMLSYIAAFALVAIAACEKDVPAVGPPEKGGSLVESSTGTSQSMEVGNAGLTQAGVQSVAPSDRAKAALASVAWIGEGHDSAMQDLIKHKSEWIGNDRKNTRRICDGLVSLVAKHGARADKHIPTALSGEARNAKAKQWVKTAVANTENYSCGSIGSMNLFAVGAKLRVATADDPAWLSYANDFMAAVEASDGSPEAVAALGTSTLNSASSLGYDDYENLAAIVSLGNSSSDTWYTYAVENDCMGQDASVCQAIPYSLFHMPRMMPASHTSSYFFAPINHKRVLAQDLVWGVFGALAGGPVAAFWGGVAGSAGSLIDQWLS